MSMSALSLWLQRCEHDDGRNGLHFRKLLSGVSRGGRNKSELGGVYLEHEFPVQAKHAWLPVVGQLKYLQSDSGFRYEAIISSINPSNFVNKTMEGGKDASVLRWHLIRSGDLCAS